MTEKCVATVIENRLLCCVENADWHFFLRRLDKEVHVPFSEFHKKAIKPADIAKFLPNWRALDWRKIKDSMAGKSESYAKDKEFEINVYSTPNGTKKHQAVIEAFLAFMNQP